MFSLPENRWTWALYAALMVVLGWGAFGTLSTFLFDTHDTEFIIDNADLLNNLSPALFLQSETIQGRPTVNLYIWAAYKFCRKDPACYHMLQVGLHLAASLLLAFTCRQLGSRFGVSLATGVLFLMNVAHFRAVHWISCNGYVLALILGLCTVLMYHRGLETGRLKWIAGSLVAFAAAVFAHPAIVPIVLLCGILTWQKKKDITKTIIGLLPLTFTAVACIGFILVAYPDTPQIRAIVRVPQFTDILQNLFWFWGRQLTTAHWLPRELDLVKPAAWEQIVGAVFLLGISIFAVRRSGVFAFWATWAFLLTLPFLSADMGDNASGPSRYLYIASAGVSFLLARILHDLIDRAPNGLADRTRRVIFLGVLVVLTASSFFGLKGAKAISLYQSGRYYIAQENMEVGGQQMVRAIEGAPGWVPFDAYIRLAAAFFAHGIPQTALFEEGLKLYPDEPQLLLLSGISAGLEEDEKIREKGEEQILRAFEMAESEKQFSYDASLACLNLATHFHRTGKYQKAVDLYRIVLRLRPNYALAYYNLGTILYGLGKTEMALRAYQQAMMRDSHYTTKLLDLTNKFYAQGKLEKAFKMYGAIVRLTPGSGAAHYSQGMLDYSQKRYHAALISFEQAVRHRQDDFNVYLGLAQTYEKLGRIQEAIRTYRHLLSFKPDNLQAKQRLQRLLSHQTAK